MSPAFAESGILLKMLWRRDLKRRESVKRTCDISMHLSFDPDGE
jgi:hypothetical protein